MTHEQIKELLTQYLLGDLSEKDAAEIRAHLETCEDCRAILREIEPTLGLLRNALAAPSTAPEHLDGDRYLRIVQETTNPTRKIIRWFTVGHPWLTHAAVIFITFSFVWVGSGLLLRHRMKPIYDDLLEGSRIPSFSPVAGPFNALTPFVRIIGSMSAGEGELGGGGGGPQEAQFAGDVAKPEDVIHSEETRANAPGVFSDVNHYVSRDTSAGVPAAAPAVRKQRLTLGAEYPVAADKAETETRRYGEARKKADKSPEYIVVNNSGLLDTDVPAARWQEAGESPVAAGADRGPTSTRSATELTLIAPQAVQSPAPEMVGTKQGFAAKPSSDWSRIGGEMDEDRSGTASRSAAESKAIPSQNAATAEPKLLTKSFDTVPTVVEKVKAVSSETGAREGEYHALGGAGSSYGSGAHVERKPVTRKKGESVMGGIGDTEGGKESENRRAGEAGMAAKNNEVMAVAVNGFSKMADKEKKAPAEGRYHALGEAAEESESGRSGESEMGGIGEGEPIAGEMAMEKGAGDKNVTFEPTRADGYFPAVGAINGPATDGREQERSYPQASEQVMAKSVADRVEVGDLSRDHDIVKLPRSAPAATEMAQQAHVGQQQGPADASYRYHALGNEPVAKESQLQAKAAPEQNKRLKMLNKLEKIKIPEIDFRQANINDVVAFLQAATVEYGADSSDENRGANTILNLGPSYGPAQPVAQGEGGDFASAPSESAGYPSLDSEVPLITFNAKNISALEALKIATSMCNLKLRFEDNYVVIMPCNAPEGTIVQRIYDIPPALGEKVAALCPEVVRTNAPETTREQADWKYFFSELGMTWPDGSVLRYDDKNQQITLKNTEENQEVFMKISVALGVDTSALLPSSKDAKPSPRTSTLTRMEKIIIPEIDFRLANINDVLVFLQAASAEFDDEPDKTKKGIHQNLCLATPETQRNETGTETPIQVPLITFNARHISLLEAVKIVSEVAGLKYRVEDNGSLSYLPLNAPEKIVSRSYKIPLSKWISAFKNQDSVAERIDWKTLFKEFGVPWPEGSTIKYVPSVGKLVVANTAYNLTAFDNIMTDLQKKPEGKSEEKEEPAETADLTGPRFKAMGVNPFVETVRQPFSTFSIDCDTASYTLMRNYMAKGSLPPAESVRTEEFVNFFDYAYTPPTRETFRIYVDCAPSRFGHGLNLLKIGVKGRRLGREEQRRSVLTFLVDTSGSMNKPDRIGLVKKSLKLLVEKMNPQDMIAIIQYDSHARLVLELTPVSDKKKILAAIDELQCGGSTNLEEGMQRAYEIAARNFTPGGENRVLILSDGAANLGDVAAENILKNVDKYRKQGIFCSVFGVGMGTYNDEMLEALANKGDGAYTFIDSEDEARRVLVDDLAATLNTIAKDVKIQVEFNPAAVKRYRQLGYENRQLKKEDFRNDAIDAGEVGSGQAVTALYEYEVETEKRRSGEAEKERREDLKPQMNADVRRWGEDKIGVVRVRYRRTDNGKVEEIEQPITAEMIAKRFDDTDARFRLAACAAEFSEILRASPFADGGDFEDVANALRPVALQLDLDTRVQEFLRLVQSAKGMPRGE